MQRESKAIKMSRAFLKSLIGGWWLALIVLGVVLGLAQTIHAVPVTIGGPWYEFSFTQVGVLARGCAPADPLGPQCPPGPPHTEFLGAPPWTFTAPAEGVFLTVTDAFISGDAFDIFDFGLLIGSTPRVTPGIICGVNPDICAANPAISHAVFNLAAGEHSITIIPHGVGKPGLQRAGYFRLDTAIIPEPATLLLFGTSLVGVGAAVRRRLKAIDVEKKMSATKAQKHQGTPRKLKKNFVTW